jgi:hypothetical protein
MIIVKKNLINKRDPETGILRCRKELKNAVHRKKHHKVITTLLSYSRVKGLFKIQNLLINKTKLKFLESCGVCGVCGVRFAIFSTEATPQKRR